MTKLDLCLEILGVNIDLSNFLNRKKIQKIVYLIEAFGTNLGFKFSWYVYGPYCPELTKALFENYRNAQSDEPLTDSEVESLEDLKSFLAKDKNSSYNLELIASLHYLIYTGKEQGATDKEILDLFKKKKPFFSDELVGYYFKKLESTM